MTIDSIIWSAMTLLFTFGGLRIRFSLARDSADKMVGHFILFIALWSLIMLLIDG